MNEHAMLCPTSATYLHHFCMHFQKLIQGKITKHSSYHIPHVFAVCPYRSVEIILAEVFNQLIDNTSEELIHIEEKMLGDMTQVANCKSISSVVVLENNFCYQHVVLITIQTKFIYVQMTKVSIGDYSILGASLVIS